MARTAVICDLDGTLVDVSSTIHHILVDKDMDLFHTRTNESAPPTPWVRSWCEYQHFELGHEVLMLTGRSEKYRDGTVNWLARHVTALPFRGPVMRADGDNRSDDQIKREMFAAVGQAGYQVVGAIDDRPRVLSLWRELGIDPVVSLRPDWVGSGEDYTDHDHRAWAEQELLRREHGWRP